MESELPRSTSEVRAGSRIRQEFLDFFKSKQHTIVPSSSLMPEAPNLLFTNAGMNQFVPIFLGQKKADVSQWAGAVPGLDSRAADTQKCIRAGGKHNDLEDVGLDTYHHTFFEMLGNWSFGDYFKKEAIEWAWELVTEVWKFPRHRLYATVYKPGPGDPAEFDQEAHGHWTRLFAAAGLDPRDHVRTGGRQDNFWMMGETGPCGPCSEVHVDLTPRGETAGKLVNAGRADCLEIWNLVFIQFNANPDGTFSPLPARHVDTGMGFERVVAILQCTRNFADFSVPISNYATDLFRPIFDAIEQLSGKKYAGTLPAAGPAPEQVQVDVAFRVVADHIRTLGFAIADGILPSNEGRGYVLRRILRRAVRYGRALGFHEPFFYKLVDVLVQTMGEVFPEIRAKQEQVKQVIRTEEEAFNKTLDKGIELFEECVCLIDTVLELQAPVRGRIGELRQLVSKEGTAVPAKGVQLAQEIGHLVRRVDGDLFLNLGVAEAGMVLSGFKLESLVIDLRSASANDSHFRSTTSDLLTKRLDDVEEGLDCLREWRPRTVPGKVSFLLSDTYGFPLDLTELMARERGLTVDTEGFNKLMEEQRERARKAQKKQVIEVSGGHPPTKFVGFQQSEVDCRILAFVKKIRKDGGSDDLAVVDVCPLYAEMGGQVGDTGTLRIPSRDASIKVTDTIKRGQVHYLKLDRAEFDKVQYTGGGAWVSASGEPAHLAVDRPRREAIQRHHTVTHLLHWALHEVVSRDATQKGSYVGPEKLTFDFNSPPLTPQQIADVEQLVNERILENAGVSWIDAPFAEVRGRRDVMQFFGEKYGEVVRVVQIGGNAGELDGYSMELCGGTHTRATGQIGLFRIVAEGAIAAGVRRIEAVAGLEAYRRATDDLRLIKSLAGQVNSPAGELERKIESVLEQQRALQKQLAAAQQERAAETARALIGRASKQKDLAVIVENLGDATGDYLQAVADALKGRFRGVAVLGGTANGAVALVVTVSTDLTERFQAGAIIRAIAPIVGGKGGGRADNARGGGKETGRLDEALRQARALFA